MRRTRSSGPRAHRTVAGILVALLAVLVTVVALALSVHHGADPCDTAPGPRPSMRC
ncbi:hypothetical protein OG875_08080 [Streptomyces sp. NBC_01498]|uniref:hypothetical protein n=1 Tax=Streptomyces sp. NBC_01498 TaxID=2975870 RepID=UPI002E7C0A49|nr:hypothetical protein [Streptomyces sp. NBC_01498]WTL24562.1 hypothetical protein OG875_08080 [Streptomyces sp. NBC_01498]